MEQWEKRKVEQEIPEGTKLIWGRFQGEGGYYECDFLQKIEYARIDGQPLHVDIIKPQASGPLPLLIFIQGSAWRPQPLHFAYSKMFHMASKGYVIAVVEYRNTDIARYPAPIEDTLTAIRYMKHHAKEYHVDKNRVAVWGDSSGGHVALMTGFSAGKYKNDWYPEEDDSVNAIVDFYGITDIASLGYCNEALDHDGADAPEALLLGAPVPKVREKADEASPYYNIPRGETPPTLIVHGDSDGVVSVSQSIKLYKKMREMGKTVHFVKVIHADHGLGIWQEELFRETDDFLRNYLYHPAIETPLFQHRE